MSTFIPLATDEAEKLSRELYAIARPVSVRDPRDVTTHLVGWIPRADDPAQCVLELPDEVVDLPIHAQSSVTELAKIYAAAQTKGDIAKSEKDALEAVAATSKGQAIDAKQLLPAKWKAEALTREQAIADGWLPDPEKFEIAK